MPVREVEECSRLIKNRLEKVDHVNTVKTRSSNVLPEVAALLTPVLSLHPTEFEAGRAGRGGDHNRPVIASADRVIC